MSLNRPLSLLLLALLLLARLPVPGRAAGPPRLLMVGDSTMASYEKPPADRPDLTGWGQVFQEFFVDGVRVLNRAQSGASSKSFIRTGLWNKALAEQADYVFIQFGHNDEPGKGDRSTDPKGDYLTYLRQYVDEARAHTMRPVLVTSVARRTYQGGVAVTSLTPYVDAMKKVAKEKNVPLVDLQASSLALFTRLGDTASADLSASAPDRTHFSRAGARAVASLVADELPVAVPELRPFLRPRPHLTLAPVIYAVPGVETAIYPYNVVLSHDPGEYQVRVRCDLGSSTPERWVLTPEPKDVGDHLLHAQAVDASGKVLEQATATLRVVPAKAGEGRPISLMIVGDSLTHASVYPNEIARLLSLPGNPAWKMIGTHTPAGVSPGVAHEGYGGWTWERFETRHDPKAPATGSGRSSPFVFAAADGGKPVLDVGRYFDEQNGGKRPDYVVFMLGINDCFGLNPDDPAALDAGIDRTFGHAEALLAAFRKAAPNAELGVCLTTPPNTRDAAFQANYKDRYTRWGWRRIQHRLVQKELLQFGGREKERMFLVPTEMNLDPTGGYPDNNAVHPNTAGYQQIGRSIYAWLKARLAAAG